MSKINFIDLLNSVVKFIVPTIQRDYAQGRNEGTDKELCEEVRTDIVESLFNSLKNNTELVLDYVYGSNDNSIFYPIDGQQRLTTLFLLYWYIGKKEKIYEGANVHDFLALGKFTYEIRDTSKEFCGSLLSMDLDLTLEALVSEQIRNSAKYHKTFDHDPTVNSMMVMLDKIDSMFRNEQKNLWDNLKNIKFWVLSLESFGLTDDLFVKMNARGKRLSRFDVFKSDFESKLTKNNIMDQWSEIWKKEIDNSFLDNYWAAFGVEYAEKNLFRTILFFLKALLAAKDLTNQYDEGWELDISKAKYNDVINLIVDENDLLENICNVLNRFNEWKTLVDNCGLFLFENNQQPKPLFLKVRCFGILYWFSKANHLTRDSNYEQFDRILMNYVYSLRQADYKPRRQYRSSIDNRQVNRCFCFIKELIDGYDGSTDFYGYIKNCEMGEMSFEKEKLLAVENANASLADIIDLEESPFLKRNIHNFFFNNIVHLNALQLSTIFTNDSLTNKSLRIIFSFADDSYGEFKNLLFDPIALQSGKKQLYYNNDDDQATGYFHKYSFRIDEFGDRVLTSKGTGQYDEISRCVKAFSEQLKVKIDSGLNINDAIDNLLAERIGHEDYTNQNNIKWYFVKYEEFFSENTNTTVSTLRRKNYSGGNDIDNVYDIQCLNDNNDFYSLHYHPFYLALCHLLQRSASRISIDENSLKYTGVKIEYEHPCILSNGWIIRVKNEGDWEINFGSQPLPNQVVLDNYNIILDTNNVGLLNHNGTDCIERIANFIESA